MILSGWELNSDIIWGQNISVSATKRAEKKDDNYVEILYTFPLFPGGKMLPRSEGEDDKLYFLNKEQ